MTFRQPWCKLSQRYIAVLLPLTAADSGEQSQLLTSLQKGTVHFAVFGQSGEIL